MHYSPARKWQLLHDLSGTEAIFGRGRHRPLPALKKPTISATCLQYHSLNHSTQNPLAHEIKHNSYLSMPPQNLGTSECTTLIMLHYKNLALLQRQGILCYLQHYHRMSLQQTQQDYSPCSTITPIQLSTRDASLLCFGSLQYSAILNTRMEHTHTHIWILQCCEGGDSWG